MTEQQAREALLAELRRIAPEFQPEELDPGADLREQADIDSVDFLNLVVALGEAVGVEIPEEDYGRLQTLDGFVAYLVERSPGAGGDPATSPGVREREP